LTAISEPELLLLREITSNYLYDLLYNYLLTDRTCNFYLENLWVIDPVDIFFDLAKPAERFNVYINYNLHTFWENKVGCTNYPPLKAALETQPEGVYAAMLTSSVLTNLRDVHWFDLECWAGYHTLCDPADF
jgi:hypothetical protein